MAWAGNVTGRPPFWFGQGFGEIADPEAQPAWRDLEIGTIAIKGTAHRVSEQRRILSPFATLTEIDCEGRRPLAKCLVVMPQSGHFSLILRDLITGLLSDNDVIILDWTNARHIPLTAGEFGFDDTISTIVSVLRSLESSVHLIGVCQSAIPAIIAAVALHQTEEKAKPVSLTLISSPVDPLANPTRVSSMLAATPIADIEKEAITIVASGIAGAGRKVFSASNQQRGLLIYLGRHFWEFGPCWRKVINDDGGDADKFPFLTLFTSLMDIPGKAFLESISAIYQDRILWSGKIICDGQVFAPGRIETLPLMTVEAENDDIAAPGQTYAAHKLFGNLPVGMRGHFLLRQGGHFSSFHGDTCRNEVAPAINRFLQLTGSSR